MAESTRKINEQVFKENLKKAYNAVFKKASKTALYVLAYPDFFNAQDYDDWKWCSKTCFQFGVPWWACDQWFDVTFRNKINSQVRQLNEVIYHAVKSVDPPQGASIQMIDTNPEYDGHRFCEKNVQEVSHLNTHSPGRSAY